VTWLGDGGARSNCAIVEYVGYFPGLCPHGNSTDNEAEYTRIPKELMGKNDTSQDPRQSDSKIGRVNWPDRIETNL
jgi:hypothetical protein